MDKEEKQKRLIVVIVWIFNIVVMAGNVYVAVFLWQKGRYWHLLYPIIASLILFFYPHPRDKSLKRACELLITIFFIMYVHLITWM